MPDQRLPEELRAVKVPKTLPIIPIFNAVAFPTMTFPMEVHGAESIALIDEVMTKDRLVGVVTSKTSPPEIKTGDLYRVGICAGILKMAKVEDAKAHLILQGISRVKLNDFVQEKPYIVARVEALTEETGKDIEIEALMANLVELFDRIVKLSSFLPREFIAIAKSIAEPGTLADMVGSIINVSVEEKQAVLEIYDVRERLKEVTKLVNHQLEILELGNKIQSQVKSDIDKGQREFYLRQQLKAIRDELGEKDDTKVEIEEYRAKVEAKRLPAEAKKEAERELERLSRMHPSSAEYTVASTYLDWIVALPWNESTADTLDIKKARRILDEDHYGLEKPKKRIIEYLAVRKLKPDSKGPILCFVGPPGTGKTSMGQSIARALGRKFMRISLGGVHDEAEIRGHRRTYIGALPGRIIQGIRRTEMNNPVFMLDEIDKLGMDFRGDPSSALLEVLDPEQNFSFMDHYLDVPFDLSRVMFITTANILDTIPPALRDRLEVIELPGYTRDEKIKIARQYLIPKQIAAHGLTKAHISFSVAALNLIISGYTREAGVRNLEREIATICRGVATKIAEGYKKAVKIGPDELHAYLGPVRMVSEISARISRPGVAIGLAWTPTGGEILFVEATAMKGRKGLTLTGQLGDVMKESATAALSFIRANAKKLGISVDFFDEMDIHVHIPAGAIPKDGPSAGVTMLTALASLLTGKKVKKNLAMTGEITLRGLVLPVGGVKEKVLAAHRAGIRTIILPQWNKKDLEDIPPKVKKDITFLFVDDVMDVLKKSLS
ncbi:MAG: endopeptidase La [Deltaproteobacteria bacterium]|nr:endopeptidase La [Deltaproteobacteria bacterium]